MTFEALLLNVEWPTEDEVREDLEKLKEERYDHYKHLPSVAPKRSARIGKRRAKKYVLGPLEHVTYTVDFADGTTRTVHRTLRTYCVASD